MKRGKNNDRREAMRSATLHLATFAVCVEQTQNAQFNGLHFLCNYIAHQKQGRTESCPGKAPVYAMAHKNASSTQLPLSLGRGGPVYTTQSNKVHSSCCKGDLTFLDTIRSLFHKVRDPWNTDRSLFVHRPTSHKRIHTSQSI